MAKKADLIKEAEELGLPVTEGMKAPEIQKMIDDFKDGKSDLGENDKPDKEKPSAKNHSVDVKAIFEKHPHVHTLWVSGKEWWFYAVPGAKKIEKAEVI